jgi:hypothetical protein
MCPALAKTTAERIKYPSMAKGQSYVLDFDEFVVRNGLFCRCSLGGRFGEAFQGRSSDSEQFRALAFGLRYLTRQKVGAPGISPFQACSISFTTMGRPAVSGIRSPSRFR